MERRRWPHPGAAAGVNIRAISAEEIGYFVWAHEFNHPCVCVSFGAIITVIIVTKRSPSRPDPGVPGTAAGSQALVDTELSRSMWSVKTRTPGQQHGGPALRGQW